MRKLLSVVLTLIFICSTSIAIAKKPAGAGKGLPPGLQKKVDRGGSLPPGWQKKLSKGSVLDVQVYKAGNIIVPPDPTGLLTIKIEDRILKIHKDTRKILSILR